MATIRSRLPASLYVAGPFAMGYTEFYNFLIPLYGLSLGMSAGQIGMLVGARSLLAVFLSIHVGVLMDRLGTRRVALFFVWTAMALAPVFPLLPWFWPLLLLQVVNGAALQFAWSGSQTLIAQLAEGEAEYLGRFSLSVLWSSGQNHGSNGNTGAIAIAVQTKNKATRRVPSRSISAPTWIDRNTASNERAPTSIPI